MDRVHDIRIAGNVVLDAGDFLRVFKQPLHFGLRTAVAELQVIEHGVICFCEPLICVLD